MSELGKSPAGESSRRQFLKASTVAAVAGGLVVPTVHAAGSETIRVGVIGCGGRGTGAAENAATASEKVRIVAMGDTFQDHINNARSNLHKLGEQLDVPDERCFVGFDAFEKVLDCDLDYVILATPPGFRPQHLKAAVAAGKHVFAEKPVAVDGPGIRTVLEAAEEAQRKRLSIVAGTQRRHQKAYIECLQQIHDGAIGEITSARCSWMQGGLWSVARKPEWSDMEWQLRNWLYFTWLSGDHICEQHVHNLDVVNWALQAHPLRAVGMGGRQVRTDPLYGNIYDHFAIDFEYPNNVHVTSLSRQIGNCMNDVSEQVVGTKGDWSSSTFSIRGENRYRYRGQGDPNPYVQEHGDLIASIRDGQPLNELRQVAESTLTAIMGRLSAYTGQAVSWEDALNSRLNTFPDRLEWGEHIVAPVALPGITELV